MKILMCGDIVGRAGREVVLEKLPKLIQAENIKFVIINGENSASGYGITRKICEELYSVGVDVITSGNHIWDQREIVEHIINDKRLLRPCNYPENSPGNGFGAYKLKSGDVVVVVNVMCRLFMDSIDNPFKSVDEIVETVRKKFKDPIIIVDIHGESTSEKMALAHFLDGRVLAIFGTHTHVPTADLQILEKGSFFQTDLGMCGDYDSVIGMKKEMAVLRFTHKHIKSRLKPANGNGTLCGTIIELDSSGMKIIGFNQIFKGGKLHRN